MSKSSSETIEPDSAARKASRIKGLIASPAAWRYASTVGAVDMIVALSEAFFPAGPISRFKKP